MSKSIAEMTLEQIENMTLEQIENEINDVAVQYRLTEKQIKALARSTKYNMVKCKREEERRKTLPLEEQERLKEEDSMTVFQRWQRKVERDQKELLRKREEYMKTPAYEKEKRFRKRFLIFLVICSPFLCFLFYLGFDADRKNRIQQQIQQQAVRENYEYFERNKHQGQFIDRQNEIRARGQVQEYLYEHGVNTSNYNPHYYPNNR
jgi:hypothetical protein